MCGINNNVVVLSTFNKLIFLIKNSRNGTYRIQISFINFDVKQWLFNSKILVSIVLKFNKIHEYF